MERSGSRVSSILARRKKGGFFLIAGPCVIESESHCLQLADRLKEIAIGTSTPLIFKASFDKANRTSIDSFRGPGFDRGLEILRLVRTEMGLPVTSDIHEPWQAEGAAEVLDLLQIPAFLCRQTDLVLAAAATGKPINVKKGQFLAPWDVRSLIGKARSQGCREILITERGTSFGYNNLVVDFRSLPLIRAMGVPVVFDATHSVQLPGGGGDRSSGQAEFIGHLARAAVAVGVDGLFLEVHDHPEKALSDGANSLGVDALPELLQTLKRIDRVVTGPS